MDDHTINPYRTVFTPLVRLMKIKDRNLIIGSKILAHSKNSDRFPTAVL